MMLESVFQGVFHHCWFYGTCTSPHERRKAIGLVSPPDPAPLVRTILQATHSSSQGTEATWCFKEVVLVGMFFIHLGLLPGVLKLAVVTWCKKESTWHKLSALWRVSSGRIVGVPSSPTEKRQA